MTSGVCEFTTEPDDVPVPSELMLTTDVPESSGVRVGVEKDEAVTADDVEAREDALVELVIDATIVVEGVVDVDSDARPDTESRPLMLVEAVLDGDAIELTDACAEIDVCADPLAHSEARGESVFKPVRVFVEHALRDAESEAVPEVVSEANGVAVTGAEIV